MKCRERERKEKRKREEKRKVYVNRVMNAKRAKKAKRECGIFAYCWKGRLQFRREKVEIWFRTGKQTPVEMSCLGLADSNSDSVHSVIYCNI